MTYNNCVKNEIFITHTLGLYTQYLQVRTRAFIHTMLKQSNTQYKNQLKLLAFLSSMRVSTYCEERRDIFIDVFINQNVKLFDTDIDNDTLDKHVLCIQGLYFCYIEKNYEKAKKCWLLSIAKNNIYSMYCLGNYYQRVEINYELMKTYYLMAIEKGDIYSMEQLGRYYQKIGIYEMALHYWLMILEDKINYDDNYKSSVSMLLGNYYIDVEKNLSLAEPYFLMASKHISNALYCLGYCHHMKKNYEQAKHYYKVAVEQKNVFGMYGLGMFYVSVEHNFEQGMQYFIMALERKYFKHLDTILQMTIMNENKITVYENLYQIMKHVVMDIDSSKHLKIFEQNSVSELVMWKILNKLEQTVPFSSTVSQFKNSLKSENLNKFKYYLEISIKNNLYDICPLCLEPNTLIIKTGCTHGVCYDCCDPSKKCFFKWCEK